MHKDRLIQCRLCVVLVIKKNLLVVWFAAEMTEQHYFAKIKGIFAPKLSKTLHSLNLSLESMWGCAWGAENP